MSGPCSGRASISFSVSSPRPSAVATAADGEEEIKSSDVIVLIAFFPLGGGNTPRTMDRVVEAAANCGMRERGL